MTTGERIKMLRENLGYSQAQLAKLLGYKSRSTINKIELGINDITQSKIKAFADVLNTTPAFLIGINTDSKTPILSDQDKRLVDMFDQLDDAGKDHMLKFMQALLDSQQDV